MTYSEYKTTSNELNAKVTTLSNELNSFDWRNEEVRMSVEFQTLKTKYNTEFANLQNFNKRADKKYSRQLVKERRALRYNN